MVTSIPTGEAKIIAQPERKLSKTDIFFALLGDIMEGGLDQAAGEVGSPPTDLLKEKSRNLKPIPERANLPGDQTDVPVLGAEATVASKIAYYEKVVYPAPVCRKKGF